VHVPSTRPQLIVRSTLVQSLFSMTLLSGSRAPPNYERGPPSWMRDAGRAGRPPEEVPWGGEGQGEGEGEFEGDMNDEEARLREAYLEMQAAGQQGTSPDPFSWGPLPGDGGGGRVWQIMLATSCFATYVGHSFLELNGILCAATNICQALDGGGGGDDSPGVKWGYGGTRAGGGDGDAGRGLHSSTFRPHVSTFCGVR
jgi:hypothetical protein